MTFDPALPHKNVDGVNINLTQDEIVALQAQRDIWAAEKAARVSPVAPVSDLINTLIANGVITADQLQPTTVTTVNQSLEAAKLSPIAVSAQPEKLV